MNRAAAGRSGHTSGRYKKKRRNRLDITQILLIVIGVLAVILIAAIASRGCGGGSAAGGATESDAVQESTVADGAVTVNGVNIYGMTQEEARKAILDSFDWKMKVKYEDKEADVTNLMADKVDQLLEEIYASDLKPGETYEVNTENMIEDAKAEVARAKEKVDTATATQNEFKVARGKLEVQVEAAIKAITADGNTVLEEALMLPAPTDRDAAERELNQLVRQINNLGPVNQVAMEEYEQLKRRADYIEEQLADLESARKALTKITVAIDRKMRKAFLVTFEKVDANFREIFAMLFPGGQAHLEMTDPEHPAETGIEVVAQPRGKRITKMMLMSGGEKSLTALALLFAVYRTRTVPFYVLDEVEAALDDANLSKLIGALDVLRSDTQLLVISHQRRTMEDADVLYGVSMQADGVSRVVSQKLDRETGKVVNA